MPRVLEPASLPQHRWSHGDGGGEHRLLTIDRLYVDNATFKRRSQGSQRETFKRTPRGSGYLPADRAPAVHQ